MIATLWLLAGFTAGTVHFTLLRWNTLLYLTSGGVIRAVGTQLLRLASIALLLGLAAWHGAIALMLATIGMMLARLLVLRVMQVVP
jgi:N-ATPase, AtpR subunit